MSMRLMVKIFVLFLSLLTNSKADVPVAIYHAFNMRYEDIASKLEDIANQGYSHIQISPAQQSRITFPHTHKGTHDQGELWWLRYQPTNFLVLDNYYGNERDLTILATKAKAYGIEIIADLVFNHVAALDGLESPEWEESYKDPVRYRNNLLRLGIYEDFSMHKCQDSHIANKFVAGDPETVALCMDDFTNWESCKTRDKGRPNSRYECWMDGAMPSVRPTKNVLSLHGQHITLLMKAGVRGFRFDAVKNIHPDTLTYYVNFIKNTSEPTYSYLEFIGEKDSDNIDMAKVAPVTDFVFFHFLRNVFKPYYKDDRKHEGDLGLLRNIKYDTNSYVLFAENHDTAENRRDPTKGVDAQINDKRDMELAINYLLARNGGVPLILADNASARGVPSGVYFRNIMEQSKKMAHAPAHYPEYIYDIPGFNSHDIMFMSREDGQGIFILNKSGEDKQIKTIDLLNTVGKPGELYIKIGESKQKIVVHSVGEEIAIPARASVYLVRKALIDEIRSLD